MIQYDQDDLNSLALCAWKEARGEGNEGMQAVMHVIVNRTGTPGFASTVHNVIYGKNQFTSMSVPSDPEFNLQPVDDDPQYAYCQSICQGVLDGMDADPTLGAHYYGDLKYATSGWFFHVISGPDGRGTPDHAHTVKIGRQDFYL